MAVLAMLGSVALLAGCGSGEPSPQSTPKPPKALNPSPADDVTLRPEFANPALLSINKDDIEIVSSNADDRMAPADGPSYHGMDLKLRREGTCYVTFKLVDHADMAYRVQVFTVHVSRDANNPSKVMLSPGKEPVNQDRVSVKPGEVIGIAYEYYTGGEGVPGGWKLSDIGYKEDLRVPAEKPQTKPPDQPAKPLPPDAERPQIRLVYYQWAGSSEGADFTITSLSTFELDLAKAKLRILRRAAKAPNPMIPREEKSILAELEAQPWRELSAEQYERLRKATEDWLNTKPPKEYAQEMGLGTEDGHAEAMTVYRGADVLRVSVNPRPGGYDPKAQNLLTREWGMLVDMALHPDLKTPEPSDVAP